MGIRRRSNSEQGQTLVFSVMFLVVLIGFCALLIDVGSFYWVKRNLQGDADAAVLAAVRDMPANSSDAADTARSYAETRNSRDGASLELFDPNYATMTARVTVYRDAASPFGKLLGITEARVRATARARVFQVNSVDALLPFAALEHTLEFTNPPTPERITFSPGHGQDQGIQNGHIGAIAPKLGPPQCAAGTGNSAEELESMIIGQHGDGGKISCGTPVGEDIDTATGDRPTAIQDGFNDRLGSMDGTHSDTFNDVLSWDASTQRYIIEKPDSPRIGFIPVISTGSGLDDWDQINGTSAPVRVIDYVMVYVGRIGFPGEPAYVRGNDCEPEACRGQQLQVFLTPIRGVMTPNFDYKTNPNAPWDPNSNAPISISLVE